MPSKSKAQQSAAQADKKYDPRDFLDDAARKRVQEIIKASREKNQEQLKKEGKGLGMFINEPSRNSKSQQQQPHQQQRTQEKKKSQDFEEVFDHLEEPDFDEEEMHKTAELLRQRQQASLAARQK